MTVSIQTWIHEKTLELESSGFLDDARFSCLILLSHFLNVDTTWIYIHSQDDLPNELLTILNIHFEELKRGRPLPYIIGEWDFFGYRFNISEAVLIPRPETELLVKTAIEWLNQQTSENRSFIDVGTGTGCIPVSILMNIDYASGLAIDISIRALKIAADNRSTYNLENRLQLVCGDLLTPIIQKFNLITANLPYIPTKKLETTEVKKHEPLLALDGGIDGFSLIKRLLIDSVNKITKPGLILLEIEEDQGEDIEFIAAQSFPNGKILIHKDYANRDRFVQIEL